MLLEMGVPPECVLEDSSLDIRRLYELGWHITANSLGPPGDVALHGEAGAKVQLRHEAEYRETWGTD
jgi:hypothetical protein